MWEWIAGAAALAYIAWFFLVRATKLHLPGDANATVPVITGWLPWIGCGLQFVRGPPRSFLERMQKKVGPTFVLDMFGMRLLFTFSPVGLKSLYKVPEKDASFTEATRGLLSLKLPEELIEGSMIQFHKGLRRPLVQTYIKRINAACDESIAQLGKRGEFEIFAHMKQLLHKISVLCWVGSEACQPRYFDRITAAFEALDPEAGFSNVTAFAWTILTRRYREKRALDDLEKTLRELWEERQQRSGNRHVDEEEEDELNDNLASLHKLYADLPENVRHRKVAVATFQFHLASLINMYAAISWTMINVLTQGVKKDCDGKVVRPLVERLRAEREQLVRQYDEDFTHSLQALDEGMYGMECIAQESLRLAQQSITLRKVMRPALFEDEKHKYQLPRGMYLGTLISITNVAEPDVGVQVADGVPPLSEFNADRYDRTRLDVSRYVPADKTDDARVVNAVNDFTYSVSTFGHGSHACPGMPFAMYAFKVIFAKYLSALTLTPQFDHAEAPAGSIGAIARATTPCVVTYEAVEARRR